MTVIGYARVSTTDQDLSIQEAALKAAGCQVIRAEKRSGTTTEGRDALRTVLEFLHAGDVLMVTRIDRLARSIGDLQDIVRTVRARGAVLKATEQPINTGTAAGKCFLDMLGVFAEFETNLRRERQLEGIAKAKAAGVYKGAAAIDRSVTGARTEGAGHAALGHRQGAQDRSGIGVSGAGSESQPLMAGAHAGNDR
jgi:DNA invertase Pin-like site-specific DNA recombinase